jgi:hypothetical protein
VWKSEGELDLVRGDLGIASTLEGASDGNWPRANGSPGDTEGVHDGWRGGEDAIAGLPELDGESARPKFCAWRV